MQWGIVIPMVFATLGLWMVVLAPVVLLLPLQVAAIVNPTHSAGVDTGGPLSLVLAPGALAAIVLNPIVGHFSDRSFARTGSRRVWLLATAIAAACGVLFIGAAGSLWMLALGWALASAGGNALLSIIWSLMPDHIPVARRGAVSGLLGVSQAIAGVVAVLIAGLPTMTAVSILGGVAVLSVVWLAVRLPRSAPRPVASGGGLLALVKSYWVNPVRHPNFGWTWVNRFLLFLATSMVVNYQVYFLMSVVRTTAAETQRIVQISTLVITVGTLLGSFLGGFLSDRLRGRKYFVVAAALLVVVGFAVLILTQSIPGFFVAMFLVGLGNGTYFAVDIAVATQVLPDEGRTAGKDLAVFNLANNLPQSLAPAIAPLFLAIGGVAGGNYVALYIAGSIVAFVGAFLILPVRGVK
ncbi:MFS transporter [Microbacterium sp. KR10-403]|uniref:MFS transporter n=1 Tax=Microbacterium sp. KR10-403 TaxID=3158581 RepID=UPI0032E426DC